MIHDARCGIYSLNTARNCKNGVAREFDIVVPRNSTRSQFYSHTYSHICISKNCCSNRRDDSQVVYWIDSVQRRPECTYGKLLCCPLVVWGFMRKNFRLHTFSVLPAKLYARVEFMGAKDRSIIFLNAQGHLPALCWAQEKNVWLPQFRRQGANKYLQFFSISFWRCGYRRGGLES